MIRTVLIMKNHRKILYRKFGVPLKGPTFTIKKLQQKINYVVLTASISCREVRERPAPAEGCDPPDKKGCEKIGCDGLMFASLDSMVPNLSSCFQVTLSIDGSWWNLFELDCRVGLWPTRSNGQRTPFPLGNTTTD